MSRQPKPAVAAADLQMFCFYFSGWATEAELLAHSDRLQQQAVDSG